MDAREQAEEVCRSLGRDPDLYPGSVKIIEQALHASEAAAFKAGLIAGVRRFAWWKDGEQHVGTCGTSLKKALAEIEIEARQAREGTGEAP